MSAPRTKLPAVQAEIEQALRLLHTDGEIFEIRAPKVRGWATASGYYNDPALAGRHVANALDGRAPSVYVTLNPVRPELIARANNRINERAENTTKDSEVTGRRWLLLDFDSQRPAGISATDSEHNAALARAHGVKAYLAKQGWAEPIMADSGNGGHLLYRIDLPNDVESRDLVNRVLKALAAFTDDAADEPYRVCLDTSVGNAARIVKLYGTLAGKGDSVPDRPHRRAHLLIVPGSLDLVSKEQLALLCEELGGPTEKAARPHCTSDRARTSAFHIDDLADYLTQHGIGYKARMMDSSDRKFLLDACPWNGHTDHSAWAIQFSNGSIALGCSHNSCRGKGLRAFRDAVEPGWDSRARQSGRASERRSSGHSQGRTSSPDETASEANQEDDTADQNGPKGIKVGELLSRIRAQAVPDTSLVWEAIDSLARLGRTEYGAVKGELKARLGNALNLNDLDAAVRERRREAASAAAEDDSVDVHPRMLAEMIAAAGESFAVDAGGKLYAYRDGAYQPIGERVIQRHVKRIVNSQLDVPDKWSTRLAEETVAFIAVDAPDLWDRPPLDRVNLKNGILELATRRLLPHSPDFLSPVQVPVDYDPEATCPAVDRYVETTFPGDVRPLAWEIAAWLMTPDTRIQKALLLVGEGGNGKSTFLRLLTAFVGKQNTCSVPLQRLEADRFAAVRLLGKLANVYADLPSEALAGTSVFKAITGGDKILGERKFHDSFDFTPYARLLFSANTPPRSPDASQAFYDRWVVVPFARGFRDSSEEIDSETLDARLASPAELSGLLNKALAAWERLNAAHHFTESETTRRALEDFRKVTDPFTIWLDTQTADEPEAVITKEDLCRAYNQYREKAGHGSVDPKGFGRSLKRARPNIDEAQRTINGRAHTWCWIGIRLASPPAGGGEGGPRSRNGSNGSNGKHPNLFSTDTPHPPIARATPHSDDVRTDDEGGRVYGEEQDRGILVTSVTSVTPAAARANGATPGSNGHGDFRQRIRTWAEASGWRILQVPPAHTYGGDRERWERLLSGGSTDDLVRVLAAIAPQLRPEEAS